MGTRQPVGESALISHAKQTLKRVFTPPSHSLLPLVLLGCVIGVFAGLVMACFISLLSMILGWLNGSSLEDFESLAWGWRLGLPILGSLLLILLYRFTPASAQTVGLAYVVERLQFGRGRLPLANTAFQFVAALIALGSGHSVGREGPAVQMGAGVGSWLGQRTHRPPSQLRLLVGCGTAAAISAAFNTPLAGVLFAMEVVLMEYSILGFAPIVASAVSASAFSRILLGEHTVLTPTRLSLADYGDIPSLLLTGLWLGLVAVIFLYMVRLFLRFPLKRRSYKLLLAGVITGVLALWVPEILGSGYDTINLALSDQLPWLLLAMILLAKLFATAAAIGLGVPGGQIAPMLMVGVCAGGLAGTLVPGGSEPGLYALLGMAAMMAAVLHAPLAAIATVLELSLSAQAMFPAMTVVLTANLVCQHGFRQPSLILTLLKTQGRLMHSDPLRTALAQRYLTELASLRFSTLDAAQPNEIAKVLSQPQPWVVVDYLSHRYLLKRTVLEQAYELQQVTPVKDANLHWLTSLLTANRRLKELSADASLLTALKNLQQEDCAGFLLPVGYQGVGLVTRRRLVRRLTSDERIH
ncbi:chloride channel protein [Oceanisphaera avium]|uniref:Chloride transporter ClC family protein n=1 Tax=Oceanisphaera avium TaxID=1903694 RepID=A0A1Y0D0Y2_9GAMM|nr:chloride channel protein [Oceanisphaera avium]ART80786.1 chloride transporter ClC family protein [Oceanisphaera avium]